MSDSELLRIKNKQKASYKSRKTARSNIKNLSRPNDRFGLNSKFHNRNYERQQDSLSMMVKKKLKDWLIFEFFLCKNYIRDAYQNILKNSMAAARLRFTPPSNFPIYEPLRSRTVPSASTLPM